MEKRKKRARGLNWNHAHTMALAELKREASLNKEDGRLVWERIAQTLSSRFPDQIRTGDQCRRRWDTLVKVYNHIEDYCIVTGATNHRELDEGELASMKLGTAYQQDWYDIVEQVCSQRERKERCDSDPRLAKRSKGSHSVPERPPNGDTLCPASTSKSVNYHEQSTPESTTTYAQVPYSPSLKADKLSLEEEVPRLKNGNDALMLEERQRGQVSHEVSQQPQTLESANLLPQTFPAEDGADLEEPKQDDLWALLDDRPFDMLFEIEQPETESELTEPFYWDLEPVGARPKDSLLHDSSVTAIAQAGNLNDFKRTCTAGAPEPGLWINDPDWKKHEARKSMRINDYDWKKAGARSSMRINDNDSMSDGMPELRIRINRNDSMIPRQSRRWSLKVIVLKIRQCCHARGRKERAEDMEMESKQAARLQSWLRARLKGKTRKEAPMSRKENVPAMLNAASSTSATSAARGDKPLQKDTQRVSKQAALDKKEEETMGGKSSSKCLPIGKLSAKLSRKLFPVFCGHSSH